MDIPLILIIVGSILVLISFFIEHSSKSDADALEKVSISLHQETNGLNKRLRAVEEELMIGIGTIPTNKTTQKPQSKVIHEIIINQILSLHAQDFSVDDIAKRSSLTSIEVSDVLRSKGVS